MTHLPISLCVITKNEENNLSRCLASAPFAGELLVVDSLSTDATASVAKKLGARVIEQAFLGYGAQKHFAASQAKYDWVLSLDADEALSPGLQREMISQFSFLDPKVAYSFPRRSFHLGRWIRHGGWYPDYQVRLFHRNFSQWNTARIHERVVAEKLEKFENPIEHYVFRDLFHQIETNNSYSTLQAEEYKALGKNFSLFYMLTKPISKFVELYLFKRGFLDGMAGFIIAVGAAYSVFLRFSKLWEFEQWRRGSQPEPKPGSIPSDQQSDGKGMGHRG